MVSEVFTDAEGCRAVRIREPTATEWAEAAGRAAAEWHRYLHREGILVPDEGQECGPWHHRVFEPGIDEPIGQDRCV